MSLALTRLRRGEDFGPTNCAWLPRSEAVAFNRPRKVLRTPHRTITAFGETKGPVAWSKDKRCTVSMSGLVARLRAGATPERAITDPAARVGLNGVGRMVKAFGVRKSLADWGRDRRARVGVSSIAARLDRGMRAEAAITTPAFKG